MELIKYLFFYNDKENNNPSMFSFHSNIEYYDKDLLESDLDYYYSNPKEFLKDMVKNYENSKETLFKVLKNSGNISISDRMNIIRNTVRI